MVHALRCLRSSRIVCEVLGGVTDLRDDSLELLKKAVEPFGQLADLIVAVDRETLCEVTLTLGDVFESVDHRNQRFRDVVRNNPKENGHGAEDDNNEEYTTKLAALCCLRTNFAELLLDIGGKLFSELV